MNTLPLLSIPNLNLTGLFVLISLFITLQCHALEFRSISGPPETSGSIDRGGVMVVGCTLQYPGVLDESTLLYLVGTDGNRTQVSFSSLTSSTSQSFSTVPVPKDVQSGYYFLVAVESANRTVIASSSNFQISSTVRDSNNSTSSSGPNSTNPSGPSKKANVGAGAIAGGVIGGVFGVVLVGILIFFFIRRRRRRRRARFENSATDITQYFEEPTPFLGVAPTRSDFPVVGQGTGSSSITKMEERKLEMVERRERLRRQLDDYYRQHTQSGSLRSPTTDNRHGPERGGEEGDDTVELQRQVGVMTRRIAMLEAELAEQAPPEYVSEYNP
ncbi:hypothetical protein L218DRAFT_995920 [Marasmius fiardii PR-910]|nr:hypothetical protein L218DRAFT_995920 [Marasmius fiardii PR-910]